MRHLVLMLQAVERTMVTVKIVTSVITEVKKRQCAHQIHTPQCVDLMYKKTKLYVGTSSPKYFYTLL